MRELLMQSARLGLASCPAEGSQSWLVPAGSGGLRWNCWTPEPGAAHLPPQVSGSASHTVNSLFVLLPHYFSSLSWKGRLGLPVKPSPRNDTPPSVNHSLNWGFGFKEPEVPFRVSAPGSAVHTHLPAYLEIHVFAVRLFFPLSPPESFATAQWKWQAWEPWRVAAEKHASQASFTCERSFRTVTAAQETLRLTKCSREKDKSGIPRHRRMFYTNMMHHILPSSYCLATADWGKRVQTQRRISQTKDELGGSFMWCFGFV